MNQFNQNEMIFAVIEGNELAPNLKGAMYLYPHREGTLVEIEVTEMPKDRTHPYALHIHEGMECTGTNFADSKGHYNPSNQAHPMHVGDLPPLFSNNGYSYMAVYTDQFTPEEVVGRTVIIHKGADDFHTQPSGNSGEKMACGVIRKVINGQ
ncbi:MAG: superoxide dismutase family protein [Bacilli bacterium]|nr:superoxide dismutase family protein [Bacilli bacterium]